MLRAILLPLRAVEEGIYLACAARRAARTLSLALTALDLDHDFAGISLDNDPRDPYHP